MLLTFVVVSVACGEHAASAPAASAPPPAVTHPPSVAEPTGAIGPHGIRATIVGPTSYTLAPEHAALAPRARAGEQVALDDAHSLPPPPRVDLVLRIENTTDATVWTNALEGPSSVDSIEGPLVFAPTPADLCDTLGGGVDTGWNALAPHAHVDVPIPSLTQCAGAFGGLLYWTVPGTYTIHVTFALRAVDAAPPPPPSDPFEQLALPMPEYEAIPVAPYVVTVTAPPT